VDKTLGKISNPWKNIYVQSLDGKTAPLLSYYLEEKDLNSFKWMKMIK